MLDVKITRSNLLLLGVMIVYYIFFISGIYQVPFHPDEATQIWMSSEISNDAFPVSDQFFSKNPKDPGRQHYRLIDAPLTRTVIGLANRISRQPQLTSDWNWSASWQKNVDAGALPSQKQLFISRFAVSIWVPIGLVLFFFTLRRFLNVRISITCVILMALQASFLLHTRRAMAEPLLLALYLFIIWFLFKPFSNSNLIYLSICLGLLFQTKQTSVPLIISIWLIVIITGWRNSSWRGFLKALFIPVSLIAFCHFALNPIMWKDPVRVIGIMLQERLMFSQEQFSQLLQAGSGLALPTALDRIVGLVAQIFFAPPAYFDIGNYAVQLENSISAYRENIFNTLLSGWLWGGLLFIAVSFALTMTPLLWQKGKISWLSPQVTTIIMLIFHVLFYLIALNIGFQRYYLPILPLLFLLIALNFSLIKLKKKQG